VPSLEELNDLRRIVTKFGGELTLQRENYHMLMEEYKQLEESNQMLSQSSKELKEEMLRNKHD